MKRLLCVLLALGVLCSLSGCQETGLPQPDFPLEEEAINAALEQTELPVVISEEETLSNSKTSSSYMLRDPQDRLQVITIFSTVFEGERSLSIDFLESSVPEGPAFVWEDWKQQLVFVALLYGGFADEEALYRAFSEQEMPEEAPLPEDGTLAQHIAARYSWDASLPAGYCMINYELFNSSIVNGIENDPLDTKIMAQSPRMYVDIYASEAQYQAIQQEFLERKEAMENAGAEASG